MNPTIPRVMSPAEAREATGLSIAEIVATIRTHRLAFVARRPGGRPGDRGRNRWGLTPIQAAAVVAARTMREERPEDSTPAAIQARQAAASPDGVARSRPRPPRTTPNEGPRR
jgi:hypothetical protein